jgi:hypothetical protein
MGFARLGFTNKPLCQELVQIEKGKVQSIRSTPP